MTRDEGIAEQISKAEQLVRQHVQTLEGLIAEAHTNDAHAHEALYTDVLESLNDARKSLDEAWETMANGDPEDYA